MCSPLMCDPRTSAMTRMSYTNTLKMAAANTRPSQVSIFRMYESPHAVDHHVLHAPHPSCRGADTVIGLIASASCGICRRLFAWLLQSVVAMFAPATTAYAAAITGRLPPDRAHHTTTVCLYACATRRYTICRRPQCAPEEGVHVGPSSSSLHHYTQIYVCICT